MAERIQDISYSPITLPSTQEIHGRPIESHYPKEYAGVGESLDYLLSLAEHPERRTARTIAVSEAIVDVFYPISGTKPGREGSADELIIKDSASINLGGGTNAIRGLSPFAKDVQLITRVGMFPPYTSELNHELSRLPDNVLTTAVPDSSSNAVKIRYVGSDGKVAFCINHQPEPLSHGAEEHIIQSLRETEQSLTGRETLVISDYGRGISSPRVLAEVDRVAAESGLRVIIDPRPTGTAEDMKFNIANGIITPNRQEAERLANTQITGTTLHEVQDSALQTAKQILRTYDRLHAALVTMDKDGALYLNRNNDYTYVTATVKDHEVKNPSGAGDTVVATLALLEEHFGEEQAVESAMWLAGSSVLEPDTSTLNTSLIRHTQSRLRGF